MAEIQDVLDKLDDVLDKIEDCIAKVEEVKAQKNVLKICEACNGTGSTIRSIINQNGSIGPDIEQITCSKCGGDLKVLFGVLSESEEA